MRRRQALTLPNPSAHPRVSVDAAHVFVLPLRLPLLSFCFSHPLPQTLAPRLFVSCLCSSLSRCFFFFFAMTAMEPIGSGLGALAVTSVSTSPIDGQKPGTSGLRKPTKTFMKVGRTGRLGGNSVPISCRCVCIGARPPSTVGLVRLANTAGSASWYSVGPLGERRFHMVVCPFVAIASGWLWLRHSWQANPRFCKLSS